MKRTLLPLLFCLLPGIAAAQLDRAALRGEVRDSSGAVVAHATLTLTQSETSRTIQVESTDKGSYQAVSLAPGRYTVEAEAPGFQKTAQAVILEVGQRARLDFVLAVGTLSEEVTVSAERRLMNTESAALGTVFDRTAVSKLPLAIRNWDDLLVLVSGVQGDRYTEESGGTASGRTGGVSVHGNRSLQNNFLLDGVDNNTISENVQELSTQVARPSIDSIEEFKVVTSPYSAEYGRSPGAAVSVTTKSGTNAFHGALYD